MKRLKAIAFLVTEGKEETPEILAVGDKSSVSKAAKQKALEDLDGQHIEVWTQQSGRVALSKGGRAAYQKAAADLSRRRAEANAEKERKAKQSKIDSLKAEINELENGPERTAAKTKKAAKKKAAKTA